MCATRRGADGGDETGTKRQREAQRSREAVLDAAERLFAEKSYESTSLKEIAEVAGFSRNTPAYSSAPKRGSTGACSTGCSPTPAPW